jgi:hypothetical protein
MIQDWDVSHVQDKYCDIGMAYMIFSIQQNVVHSQTVKCNNKTMSGSDLNIIKVHPITRCFTDINTITCIWMLYRHAQNYGGKNNTAHKW